MFYFSGTGYSKYVAELFCNNMNAKCHSIEEDMDFEKLIRSNDVIGFCYPIYMSNVPRMMREFAERHMLALKGKKVIIFCTQFMLSGDGTKKLVMQFPKGHIDVIYTEHFFMPNNMNDIAFLPIANNKSIKRYAIRAKKKMDSVCRNIQDGKVRKRGFSIIALILGVPQSVFIGAVERRANRAVSIDDDCNKCGLCIKICPMKNFAMDDDGVVRPNNNCTVCYRCINVCPEKAITVLLSGKIKKQYHMNVTS